MRDDYAIDRIADATTYDSEGEKVGTAGRVFTDSDDGEPTFVAVKTGLFGTSETIVPLAGARMKGDDLHLEYTKDQIKDAPRIDEDGELGSDEEDRLYSHNGLPEPEGAEADDRGNEDDDTDDQTAAEPAVAETAEPGPDSTADGADATADGEDSTADGDASGDRSPGGADETPSDAPKRRRLREYSAPE